MSEQFFSPHTGTACGAKPDGSAKAIAQVRLEPAFALSMPADADFAVADINCLSSAFHKDFAYRDGRTFFFNKIYKFGIGML